MVIKSMTVATRLSNEGFQLKGITHVTQNNRMKTVFLFDETDLLIKAINKLKKENPAIEAMLN